MIKRKAVKLMHRVAKWVAPIVVALIGWAMCHTIATRDRMAVREVALLGTERELLLDYIQGAKQMNRAGRKKVSDWVRREAEKRIAEEHK